MLTLFLAAGAALSLLPAPLGIPIALASAAVAVVAKIFGMAALFLLVGQKLVKSVAPARRPAALAAGFAVLGGVSLLPFVGAARLERGVHRRGGRRSRLALRHAPVSPRPRLTF